LLNVPPTQQGLLHETDVARLAGFSDRMFSRFNVDAAVGARRQWRVTGPRSAELILDLGRMVRVGTARLEENIAHGQTVARYALYGAVGARGNWQLLTRGTTIGYAKLERFTVTPMQGVKLAIEEAQTAPRDTSQRLAIGPDDAVERGVGGHSPRNNKAGSRRIALRAGINADRAAATVSTRAAPIYRSGSPGATLST
jgi:hypothetical protein